MTLALVIADAIDGWRLEHPAVTVTEVLAALEENRHVLTEALINEEE